MNPRITVLIDTYNHERYIEEAIASVLVQDFPRSYMEILVVDDGSTDRTPEIVRKFEGSVRLLRKPNGGQASAINFGIAQARGDFVAFLDGDDVWLPTKVSRVVREFNRDPRTVLVYHSFLFWDVRDDRVWDPHWPLVSGDILSDRSKLLAYSPTPTSSLAFRRTCLERLTPIPERCSFMHDTYLIATAACIGPVAGIPECLTRNRVHGGNLWFMESGPPNRETLGRRVGVRQSALESAWEWIQLNASRRVRSRIRLFMLKWQLGQDDDQFLIERPGRFRYFVHRCRFNRVYGWTMTRTHWAYNWTHAVFELIVGRERSHYLEGLRTRVRKLSGRFRKRANAPIQKTESIS